MLFVWAEKRTRSQGNINVDSYEDSSQAHSAKMALFTVLSVASLFTTAVLAISWTASPFNPASIPLAVRTPYLSAWLPQGAGVAVNQAWPQFWASGVRSCLFYATAWISSDLTRTLDGPVTSELTERHTPSSEILSSPVPRQYWRPNRACRSFSHYLSVTLLKVSHRLCISVHRYFHQLPPDRRTGRCCSCLY